MTGEEFSKKLYFESLLRKRNPSKTCVSVKVSWTNVHSNFFFLPKLKNIPKNIFLLLFCLLQLIWKSEFLYPSKIQFYPIDVLITCKSHLLSGWNYVEKWRYVIDKGGKKEIFEHLLRARCVCILWTDDSRGKSVIERTLVVGKKAGNGLFCYKTNDRFRLCTKRLLNSRCLAPKISS